MYFAYDACTAGDACPYLHDKGNLYQGPKPRKLKTARAASVHAGVALASSATPADATASSRDDSVGGSSAPQNQSKSDSKRHSAMRKRLSDVGSSLRKSTAFKGSMFKRAFTNIMAAMACLDPKVSVTADSGLVSLSNGDSAEVEFLVDSGAGRNLVSKRVLPESMHSLFVEAPEKLTFETGGGLRPGNKAVKLQSEVLCDNVFYQLPKCPPAVSLGIQVNQHKKPLIWLPDELHFFVKPERAGDLSVHCPEAAKLPVEKVVENVPILRQKVTSCLPAIADPPEAPLGLAEAPSSSNPAPEHLRRKVPKIRWLQRV